MSPYLGKATAAARALIAIPIPISTCGIFVCRNTVTGARVWDFLTYAQMLMHEIVHWGFTDLVRESVPKKLLWEKKKSHVASGTRTRVSIAPDFSVPRSELRTLLHKD